MQLGEHVNAPLLPPL